jgi:hypothetical protein
MSWDDWRLRKLQWDGEKVTADAGKWNELQEFAEKKLSLVPAV